MTGTSDGGKRRATYRHGALKPALIEAGTALAREGGPEAIVLREAARRVGVAPNAAYTHFAGRGALVQAVATAALSEMAATMAAEQDALPEIPDPVRAARARFRSVGAGYLRFARAEPGLFRTAFATQEDVSAVAEPAAAGPTGRSGIELLGDALDEMVATGTLPAERRPGAEFLAWATVHGLATLAIEGPLRMLDEPQIDHLSGLLLDLIDRGI
ncbi:TetR/AcrR family transcriptional regulator [Nocardia fluminea]|uniref:TetR/AcrR family transcriptional regulator n=1 Tax=Nocardia fluminea TaxID=134984 RepID=UPI0033F65027